MALAVWGPAGESLPFACVQTVSSLSQQPICCDISLDVQQLDAWKDALGAGVGKISYTLVSYLSHSINLRKGVRN